MVTDLELLWREARRLGRGRAPRKPLPPLLFFTDPIRTPHPEDILSRMPRGSGVVFRTFGAADAIDVGRRLVRIARRRGLAFLVGADIALAVALRADGVHLPERMADRTGVTRRLRQRFIVSAAAHGLAAVRRSRRSGVDAIVVSPVFASESRSAGRPLGPARFAKLVRTATVPVYGLGGVDGPAARRLSRSGAAGLAAIGAFMAPGPPT